MFTKGSGPAFSILLPTRKRVKDLSRCINELYNLAKNKNNIEYCFRVDDDDYETIGYLKGIENNFNIKYYIGQRGKGYLEVYNFFNECAKMSTGDWLFLYNDDIKMTTEYQDEIILSIDPRKIGGWKGSDEICLFAPSVKGRNACFAFPMIRRKTYEILGHVSKGVYSDAYLYNVMSNLDAAIYVDKIVIEEVYYENLDIVYKEGREKVAHLCLGHAAEALPYQQNDIKKLKNFLNQKKILELY